MDKLRTGLLKIGEGVTVMVSLWYLASVFRYLPQRSVDYSPSNMRSACFSYLSIELLLAIGLLIIVIAWDRIEELIKRQKMPTGSPVLDDITALKVDSAEEEQNGQGWVLRLSLLNIIVPIVLLLGLFVMDKRVLIVAFALVLAIIKLFISLVYLGRGGG